MPGQLTRQQLTVLILALMATGMGQSLVFAILAPLGREVHLRELQITSIIALSALIFGVAAPRWGRFSDRIGRKPIIITENGMSTSDDNKRIKSIYDYLQIIHNGMEKGIDVRGYYHWSTWDNFEWNLGPTYRFGLYACDLETKERTKRPSADIYSAFAFSKKIAIPTSSVPHTFPSTVQ